MSLIANDYFESRTAFKAVAAAAGGSLASYPVKSSSGVDGDLSVDTAFLGENSSDSIVVIMSGVHGIEGYAGAACIRQFLQKYQTHYQRPGLAFLLVHALNPWGFANDCRVTEENVDLNRNFISFSSPLPSSAQYARFHQVLCGNYAPGLRGFGNELRLLLHALDRKRRRTFQEAITAGQYAYSDGLFFGGTGPTANRDIWTRIMQAYVRPDQQVRFLDIHTGLGKSGYGSLITDLPEAAPKFKEFNKWFDAQLTSTVNASAVSAAVKGSLPMYVEEHFGDRGFAVTLEFGVASPLFTLNAMRADNWLRTKQDKDVSTRWRAKTKHNMRRAFLDRDPAWERAVLERFEWTVERLVHSLPNLRPG